jgi:hypothetical protein
MSKASPAPSNAYSIQRRGDKTLKPVRNVRLEVQGAMASRSSSDRYPRQLRKKAPEIWPLYKPARHVRT